MVINNPTVGHDNCPYCGAETEVKRCKGGQGWAYYRCPEGCGKWSFSNAKTKEIFLQPVEPKPNYADEQNQPAPIVENATEPASGGGDGFIQPKQPSTRIATAFD